MKGALRFYDDFARFMADREITYVKEKDPAAIAALVLTMSRLLQTDPVTLAKEMREDMLKALDDCAGMQAAEVARKEKKDGGAQAQGDVQESGRI